MSRELLSRLECLLSEDYSNGSLVLSRPCTVSRMHYAAALGATPKHASSKASSIFRAFDNRVFKDLIVRGQMLLAENLKAGTLPVKDGRVERRWFTEQMGISSALLYRWKPLLTHVEQVDRIIQKTAYLTKDRADALGRLKAVLDNDCPLAVSHKQIAMEELGRRAGLSVSMLSGEPFKSQIRKKQLDLLAGKNLRDCDVMVERLVLPFSELLDGWPRLFVLNLGQSFRRLGIAYSDEGRSIFKSFRKFLRWTERNRSTPCASTMKTIRAGTLPGPECWEEVLEAYRSNLCSRLNQRTRGSISTELSNLNVALNHFASAGLLPFTTRQLRVPALPRQSIRHRRSVAEVGGLAEQTMELVNFAARTLVESKSKFDTYYEETESAAFLACLKQEVVRSGKALPQSLPLAVLEIINRRLSLIKARAETFVLHSKASIAYGRELVANATLPKDFSERMMVTKCRRARRELVRQYFPAPDTDEQEKVAKANLLLLARQRFDGVLPSPKLSATPEFKKLGKAFFVARYSELGGRVSLQDLMTPSQDAAAGVLTNYMSESGANVAVGLSLKDTCMRPSEARGYTTVTGHKTKAGGKPILADLPNRDRCISDMQWLQNECRPLRSQASGMVRSRMFVAIRGDRVEAFKSTWFLAWFKRLIKDVPELTGLPITPIMMRPSVLLKLALENDGRLALGVATGQHNIDVSVDYQGKAPVRGMWDSKVRGFQHDFETVGLWHAAEVTMVSGCSEAELTRRIAELTPTGLGTFCKDRYGRPGLKGEKCNDLACAGDKCPQMEVVLYPKTAAQIQIWKSSLEQAAPHWLRDREERWLSIWLPWLCLLSVVEEKATRGVMLKVWDEGAKLREKIERQSGYVAPCPW